MKVKKDKREGKGKLENWALRKRKTPFIQPNDPFANLFCRVFDSALLNQELTIQQAKIK